MKNIILCLSPLVAWCFVMSLELLFHSAEMKMGRWPAFASISVEGAGFPALLKIVDFTFSAFMLSFFPSVILLAFWAKKIKHSRMMGVMHLLSMLIFLFEMLTAPGFWYTD